VRRCFTPQTHRNAIRDLHRLEKHKVSETCLSALSVESVSVCASTFHSQTHRNALRDPQIPPDAKTQGWRNVSRHAFYLIHTGPTRAWKILHRRFAPWTHQNAIRDPQFPPDAKTHVWRNVPWMHRNAIHNPQIPLDAYTEVRRKMSWRNFCRICIGPCFDVSIPGCTRIHYVKSRSHQMQKHNFDVTCPGVLFIESKSVPTEQEK
jgi:hypothetical protein